MRQRRTTALLTLLVSIATVVAAAPADAAVGDPTRLCPGIAAAGELANPAQRDAYVTYVPAGATLRLRGTADVLARDWTGGWQSIFFIEINDDHNMVYNLLGSYYGGPHYDQGFGGAWTNFGSARDVALVVGNDFGSSIRYTFTVILEAASGVPAAAGCSSAPAQARVMTWNLAMPSEQAAMAIADKIQELDVDVIGLQEIAEKPFRKLFARLQERSDDRWSQFWVRESRSRCTKFPNRDDFSRKKCNGNAILTRLAVDHMDEWQLPASDEVQRRLLRVQVGIGDRRLLFYNTHLNHRSNVLRRLQRNIQVEEILRLADVDAITLEGSQVIVGDFNARPWDCAMQVLRDAGYHDAWAVQEPTAHPAVFNPLNCPAPDLKQQEFKGVHCGHDGEWEAAEDAKCGFTYFDPKKRTPILRIDYVYAGDGVEVLAAETVTAALNLPVDHLPVIATITF